MQRRQPHHRLAAKWSATGIAARKIARGRGTIVELIIHESRRHLTVRQISNPRHSQLKSPRPIPTYQSYYYHARGDCRILPYSLSYMLSCVSRSPQPLTLKSSERLG